MSDRPHFPWSAGDQLFAEELNEAFFSLGLLHGTVTFTGDAPQMTLIETQTAPNPADQFSITRNVNWSGGSPIGYFEQEIYLNVNGDASHEGPVGDHYPLTVRLVENGALHNVLADTNNSGEVAINVQAFRNAPPGGIPDGRHMRDIFAYWGAMNDSSNTQSSRSGVYVDVEYDNWMNHVDDGSGRVLTQINCLLSVPLASGGYPGSVDKAIQIAGYGVYAHDWIQIGGGFNHSAIDLYFADSYAPVITSATPSSPVRNVSVDDIMALEAGGTAGGGIDFSAASTYAEVRTVVGAVTASTVVVVDRAAYLFMAGLGSPIYNFFVYDTVVPSGVPGGTKLVSVSGNTITLSNPVTLANGATLVFARAQKKVTINHNNYTVAGVTFAGPGSPAGTVYFTAAVPVADATQAVAIYPNNHAIWLRGGSDTAPWRDICFDEGGDSTLRADGAGGLKITSSNGLTLTSAGGGWSNNNWGKQLLVGSSMPEFNNPAVAISDGTGGNLFGISNVSASLIIAAMPARSDSGTGPLALLTLARTGALTLGGGGASGAWTANGTKAISLTALAPAGAQATVQEWLTVTDSTGNVRYIPAF